MIRSCPVEKRDDSLSICDHSWIYDTDRGPEFKSASLPLDPVLCLVVPDSSPPYFVISGQPSTSCNLLTSVSSLCNICLLD